MEIETVYAYKRLFCNDVCSTLVKMFVYWKDPVNKKNTSVFSGKEWAHSWQPKDSLQINENK